MHGWGLTAVGSIPEPGWNGVTSPPPSALQQSPELRLASDEQLFERLGLRDAPLGGEPLRLLHQFAVGAFRIIIIVVVDLILRPS